jgi:hypothetical protein
VNTRTAQHGTARYGEVPFLDHRQHRRLLRARSWAIFCGAVAASVPASPVRDRPWVAALVLTSMWIACLAPPWLHGRDWLLTRYLRRDRLVTLLPRSLALIGLLLFIVRFPALAWLLLLPIGTLLADYLAYGRAAALPGIRLRGRHIATSTITLDRARTGHRVLLVSVSSVGTVHYYQELTRRLLACRSAGGEVHYEGIRAPAPNRMSSATAVEQLLVASIGIAQQTPIGGLKTLGLEDASEALVIPYTSCNVDVDYLDVVRSGAANIFTKRLAARRGATAGPIMAVLRHFRVSTLIARVAAAGAPGRAAWVQLLEDRRNHALVAVQDSLAGTGAGSTLVLAWGPSHIPHFARTLAREGFQTTEIDWLEVLDISTVTDRRTGTGTITPVISSAITGAE